MLDIDVGCNLSLQGFGETTYQRKPKLVKWSYDGGAMQFFKRGHIIQNEKRKIC